MYQALYADTCRLL